MSAQGWQTVNTKKPKKAKDAKRRKQKSKASSDLQARDAKVVRFREDPLLSKDDNSWAVVQQRAAAKKAASDTSPKTGK